VRIVGAHDLPVVDVDAAAARRLLARFGDEVALDLAAHKVADLEGKRVPTAERDANLRLRELLEQERTQPHRIADLAVDGRDLIELGFREGPEVGAALAGLLDAVLDDPTLNTRDGLLEEARRLRR
jgi:tRNA nucleotidyltransferase (CCA-adding enzyme)